MVFCEVTKDMRKLYTHIHVYFTYCYYAGTGEGDITASEEVIQPCLQLYPQVAEYLILEKLYSFKTRLSNRWP